MKALYVVLMLACAMAGLVSSRFTVKTPHQGHGRRDDKIFGGTASTDIRLYPYMVSIKVYSTHVCGGVLLTMKYVLTACHCVTEIPEGYDGPADPVDKLKLPAYSFVAGTSNIEYPEASAQVRAPEAVFVHPKCQNLRSLINDHALARMEKPFQLTDYVQPAKILSWDKEDFGKKFIEMSSQGKTPDCRVNGWGEISRGNPSKPVPSPTLKSVRMTTLSNEECMRVWTYLNSKVFNNFDFSKHGEICAMNTRGLFGSDCVGDSGSPYICNSYLIATVSFGATDCTSGSPSVYSTFGSLLDWIKKDFSKEIPEPKPSTRGQFPEKERLPSNPGRSVAGVSSNQECPTLTAPTFFAMLWINLAIKA